MIVGTAGHIDHGKTALVRALTGVDTDRLKEEKARGISIDLGFAYLPVANGGVIGFVDVPGHDRFVRNMLAGATGIDFVLLAVAADDGIMPQTREHLAIVDLLGINRGVVALTKSDLVSSGQVAAVTDEVRALLQPTGLAAAPIMPVSTLTGDGLGALREQLLAAARAVAPRSAGGRFRLAVDRCFTLTGVGTIVTGAVLSGAVTTGESVMVSPAGLRARVRSIHAQNATASRGVAGERCALSLSGDGIDRKSIARGAMVLDPSLHAPSARIDARLQSLASNERPLAHWTPVRLHHAAVEVGARVAVLENSSIAPGSAGLVQLVLEQPIAAAARDRFIVRDTSGSRTLGGGYFIDLRAPQRRRRVAPRLTQLAALDRDLPAEALAGALACWPWVVDVSALARDCALSMQALRSLLAAVPLIQLAVGDALVAIAPATREQLVLSLRSVLEVFHRERPELPGLAPLKLAALVQPRLPPAVFAALADVLVQSGECLLENGALRLPAHRIGLDSRDATLWARIAPLISDGERFRPLLVPEIATALKTPEADLRRVLKALARQRLVVEVALDRFFLRATVDELAGIVTEIARSQTSGQFSAAQLRDRLDNGRKVAIQILEYFDGQGLTLRRGDLRSLRPRRVDATARAP